MNGMVCVFYSDDLLYDGRLSCQSNELCYCFPQQVEVDKPCQDVSMDDYLITPNLLMKYECSQVPEQTLHQTPELTPYQTPELTPQLTPEQTANYTVPRTEEPSISFKIIEEQQSKVYIYTTIGFFALLFIIILIVIIYCCRKKHEATSGSTIDAEEEVPVILPAQQFPITITLDEFPSYSDPFSEDFQVSDEYFDALEKEN